MFGCTQVKVRLLIACFLGLTIPGFAEYDPEAHTLELGASFSYFAYDENIMETKGPMAGLHSSWAYRGNLFGHPSFDNSLLKVDSRLLYGNLKYEGGTWGGAPLEINNDNHMLFEFRFVTGRDFTGIGDMRVTPYLGFGYRYLIDYLADYVGDYRRESRYYYIPIGVDFKKPLPDDRSWGWTLEYDYFLRGRQWSQFSRIGFDDIGQKQSDGYGYRVSLHYSWTWEYGFYVIEPYYMYWSVQPSELKPLTFHGFPVGGHIVEPDNHTQEIGVRITVVIP